VRGERLPRGVLIADQLARNLLMTLPAVARRRARQGRTAAAAPLDAAYLARYAWAPFTTLVEALGEAAFEGRAVGEIGPGDHVPLALLALAAGARSYTAFDRFAGDVGGPAARRLYACLEADIAATRPALARRLAERGISAASFPEAPAGLVECVHAPIEALAATPHGRLDLLFSFNVVEHLTDVSALARASERLLAPGGVALHRVDFGPHDVWFGRSSEFEWLTIPDALWRWMGSRRGAPNRLRFHEVVERLSRGACRVEARVLERFDAGALRAALPGFARRFRAMPFDSLCVKTALLVCRLPAPAAP
jgi:SAM-dependent methyltransferase